MGRGRAPCCAKVGLNRGSWTPQEDMRLIAYIQKHGHANWRALPKQAGLLRCGKSCRLRWINYLRPDLKRGNFTADEEDTIIKLHGLLGNKWSKIASCLPGRTDNEIKNVWNTHLKKRVSQREKPGDTKKKGKAADASDDADAHSPSSSASSSTTTAANNNNSGDTAGEQCGTSKEPENVDVSFFEQDIDISDMLVDAPTEAPLVAAPMPPSPCSSSSLTTTTCVGAVSDELLDLPEIDIEPDIWSIIDGYGGDEPGDGDATVPCTASPGEEGAEWWVENLEKELGLWGPMDESLAHPDPPGQVCYPGPLTETEGDPVSTYFQSGPTASPLQEIASPAVLS
ncbi:myb-related protein Zm1 [Oryza sativa Japonica Group]|uniref:Myb-related protein 1 n=3 Tax=Oryza TaxID=4527 RepID=Q0DYG5_ORYSJ|nr:myb-related protein Zm1 [Oryza sativa Japonica Group]EAZ24264.1 hypothetical protein OsJ_08015 [Oryza sativa Japonica Group]KAF2946464.1 hypothetical protein DAI22_02g295500 [Oryza sativa Japonica Group]BAD07916.1 putative myb-related protein 1 [Oryza sativa Japonica Group]BAD08151.1 putative myb-related protein 1 [Oryza sativa Japonica Group]BAF09723.1 Os02g0695200 [Oryza sativa Japonica Group]|eukprot:NP_001047809.1 Os02g0695200 [Oryza sativa Japonica Group]